MARSNTYNRMSTSELEEIKRNMEYYLTFERAQTREERLDKVAVAESLEKIVAELEYRSQERLLELQRSWKR